MATVSYQVVVMRAAYSLSGTATWSQTPTKAWPVDSAFWAIRTRSSTVASSSHGSASVLVSVWTGNCMP